MMWEHFAAQKQDIACGDDADDGVADFMLSHKMWYGHRLVHILLQARQSCHRADVQGVVGGQRPGHPGLGQVAVLQADPVTLCGGQGHQGLSHRALPLPQAHHVQPLPSLHPLLLPKPLHTRHHCRHTQMSIRTLQAASSTCGSVSVHFARGPESTAAARLISQIENGSRNSATTQCITATSQLHIVMMCTWLGIRTLPSQVPARAKCRLHHLNLEKHMEAHTLDALPGASS